ncbi:MAG: hypothetical protein ACJ8FY_10335 [Gemmataceae bacterium]
MKTKIRLVLCALAAIPGWAALHADDRGGDPTTGHVLILESERTLEGDVERVGDHYCVKRASGGKTTVPSDKVLHLAADMPDAYRFLRSQANLSDPDERLRLAQWCHYRGLKEEALAEVKAAVTLRPNHEQSQRLFDYLTKAKASDVKPSARENKNAEPQAELPSNIEVTAESLTLFSTRVQPILMNACAQCHAGDKAGKFRLARAFEPGNLGHKTLKENLTAVLSQVNLERPNTSPFLLKSISVHGAMSQPPLNNRQKAAYKTLEEWVNLTLANNPQLRQPPLETAVANAAPKEPFAASGSKNGKPDGEKPVEPRVIAPVMEKAGTAPAAGSAPSGPGDPFDPAIFNKQVHPEGSPMPEKDKP